MTETKIAPTERYQNRPECFSHLSCGPNSAQWSLPGLTKHFDHFIDLSAPEVVFSDQHC